MGELSQDDACFLKAGILWDLEMSAKRGMPLLLL